MEKKEKTKHLFEEIRVGS